ncbi:hypothetical protein [Streptomyces albidoflavus]|uniref:hypothetical protein n=1 Tax=Streptomyces albidoflavus TaxID=1886 RepID=UPI00101E6A36|nr:hypothetical protein [Streptomyces albidoflavus]RZD76165.1 hypothetical protein C0Q60_24835 [Streptomyces albidoflavus]RZD94664.1 hypothetical protein C0Q62_24715 [Streptomyces albidoflavus]
MTSLVLVPLVGLAALCLLIAVLSAVYLWSADSALRVRAWRLLEVLLRAAGRDRHDGARASDDG